MPRRRTAPRCTGVLRPRPTRDARARWRVPIALALAVLAGGAYAATRPPLPPPRPAELDQPAEDASPPSGEAAHPPGEAAPAAPTPPLSCLAELRAAGVLVEPAAQPTPGRAGCLIDSPVRLSGLPDPTSPGRSIRLVDRPVIACRLARAFFGLVSDRDQGSGGPARA